MTKQSSMIMNCTLTTEKKHSECTNYRPRKVWIKILQIKTFRTSLIPRMMLAETWSFKLNSILRN